MNNKLKIASVFIVFGAIMRLLPHPHNITPVAAMALAGGIYIGRKYLSYIVPIVCLFVSDLILNNTVNRIFFEADTGLILFEKNMIFTYTAFALTVVLGAAIKHFKGLKLIFGGAVLSSLLFFLISNFGAWSIGVLYPKTLAGLGTCYIAGIPFFWNTLIGNLIFIAIFVLGIETISQRYLAVERS